MFRSINHARFLTKIHEIKCKLKLAYHTTWCNLNQTQRSSIDQEIKSQKLEKLTVNIKVMNTISTILLESKLKYTSILMIGQLATQWTWFASSIQAETHKSKFKKLTWMWNLETRFLHSRSNPMVQAWSPYFTEAESPRILKNDPRRREIRSNLQRCFQDVQICNVAIMSLPPHKWALILVI